MNLGSDWLINSEEKSGDSGDGTAGTDETFFISRKRPVCPRPQDFNFLFRLRQPRKNFGEFIEYLIPAL
jgi:hypothetical protein